MLFIGDGNELPSSEESSSNGVDSSVTVLMPQQQQLYCSVGGTHLATPVLIIVSVFTASLMDSFLLPSFDFLRFVSSSLGTAIPELLLAKHTPQWHLAGGTAD